MISLRPTEIADLDFVLAAEQADENRQFIFSWTREQHINAIQNSKTTNADNQHWMVTLDGGDVMPIGIKKGDSRSVTHRIGFVLLAGLQNPHRSIELQRIVITEKGKGYGQATLRRLQAIAFDEWQAHRLWLDTKIQNVRAQKVYQSVGFVVEGTLRECLWENGTYNSLIVMSILEPEYRKLGRSPGILVS